MIESLEELRTITQSYDNHYLAEARQNGKKIIGWLCNYVPVEMIEAAGMVPLRVMGGIGEIKMDQATAFLNLYSCSYTRTVLQLVMDKQFDFLDGFVNCATCDGMRRLGDAVPYHTALPIVYTMSIPHKMDAEAVRFFLDELETTRQKMEGTFGVRITDEALSEAIKSSNQARRLLARLYQVRKRDNPPLGGSEVQVILNAMTSMPLKAFLPLLENILAEVEAKSPEGEGKVRLMLSGSILNNYEFIKGIEALGGVVVIDALCNGTRHWLGEIDLKGGKSPLEALAGYYLTKFPCPRMYPSEERFEIIADLAKEYRVQGMIATVIRYCSIHILDAPRVKDRLLDLEIPVLTLDMEYGAHISGQVKTRVQAFIEMLQERGENP